MAVLDIKGLKGGYSEVDILKGIDLRVAPGEIVTVVGTNGAGKSTLIKAVMGLLPRVSGQLEFDGVALGSMPTQRRLDAGVGYVPQLANVFASLTVLENLLVVQRVPDTRRRAEAMIDLFADLRPLRKRRAATLSGGERQQLAFARALMSRPRLICLDEPTAALSPLLVKAVFEQIRRLPEQACSVLMVEQRARDALHISHRGYILDQGQVAMSGNAAGLLDDPRAAELYLGSEP